MKKRILISIFGLVFALIFVLLGCAPSPTDAPPTERAQDAPTVTPFPTFPTQTPGSTWTATATLRPSGTPFPTNTSFPSLTPRPSATLTPAVVGVGEDELPYKDDFSDVLSGWPVGSACEGSYGYDTNATYRMINGLPYCPLCVSRYRTHYNAIIEVNVTKNSGADDAFFGVTCRKAGEGNYFALMINGDQEYIIKRVVGAEEIVDTVGTSGAIRGGNSSNRLVATCNGDVFSIQVNGREVASVVDPFLAYGFLVGLIVQTQEGAPVDVTFDNFDAYAP
jgi:hypothetical protein